MDDILNVLLRANQRQCAKSIHQDFKKEKLFPFIEITSDRPGSGKTHILYHIITIAILPSHFNGVPLNGKNGTVVFLDSDLRFDVCRLSQVIRSYVVQCSMVDNTVQSSDLSVRQNRIVSTDLDILVGELLKHVHVIQQWSMGGLLESLEKLPHYLLVNSNHCSAKRHLHSILIDSASAFYWESRMKNDEKGDIAALDTGMSYTKTSYLKLARLLHRLQATFACIVVATTWSYSQFNPTHAGTPEPQPWKSILPSPWLRLPTVRMVVKPHVPRSSQPHSKHVDYAITAVPNTLKMEENLVQTNFAAWLDESNFENRDDQVLNDLRQIQGVPSFLFTISETGVYI